MTSDKEYDAIARRVIDGAMLKDVKDTAIIAAITVQGSGVYARAARIFLKVAAEVWPDDDMLAALDREAENG